MPFFPGGRSRIAHKVVVITGASSGIGLATARLAAVAGARVMLVARDEAVLADIAQAIRAAGGEADHVRANVGDVQDVERAAGATIARFGRIDCWISNAGVAIYARLEDTPHDAHAQLFRTNYFGLVHCATTALPHLRESRGQLIVIGSIASQLPSPIMGAYAASKQAAKAYVDALRIELKARGDPVTLTLVKPSGIATPITAHAANHMGMAARVPPPVYDVDVAAKAIVDLIGRPRREATIGGMGRLAVLAGTHFPWALDHIGRPMARLLSDPRRPPPPADNLHAPTDNGATRSSSDSGRRFSLYTATGRHRGAAFILAAAALAGTAWAGRRR